MKCFRGSFRPDAPTTLPTSIESSDAGGKIRRRASGNKPRGPADSPTECITTCLNKTYNRKLDT